MKIDLLEIGGHFIKLKGYTHQRNPKRIYKIAKQPVDKNWRHRGINKDMSIQSYLELGGWIGWVPPEGIIVVDIDDVEVGGFVTPHYDTIKIRTPNGFQMIFRANEEISKRVTNTSKEITRLGIIVDYRTNSGQIVVPTKETENREFIEGSLSLAEFPLELLPLKRRQSKDVSLLPLEKGERNDRMSAHAASMAKLKVPREECTEALHMINSMIDPLTDKEIEDMVKGAYNKFYTDGSDEEAEDWFTYGSKGPQFRYPDKLYKHLKDEHGLIPLETKEFYIFDGRKFSIISNKRVTEILREHLLGSNVKLQWINEIKSYLREMQAPLDIFNRRDDVLLFNNGSFIIRENELEMIPDSMDYKMTIEVPYNYEAGNYCDRWQDNLDRILPDEKDQSILQELMGYLLVPNNDAKKIFVLYGPGDTGKTLVLRVIERLLGNENICNVDLSMLSERFQSTALTGKLADIIDDQDFVYLKSSGIIKSITGGGTIGAEIKGGRHFNFRNYARIVYTCNKIPQAADRGDAWHTRHLILPFLVKIPESEKDRNIINTFDYNGIASWAAEGLLRLRARRWKFNTSDNVDKASAEYQRINDPFQDFLNECCIQGPDLIESYQSIREAYSGYSGVKPSSRNFSRMLVDLGYKRFMKDRRIYFKGLKLNEDMSDLHGQIIIE